MTPTQPSALDLAITQAAQRHLRTEKALAGAQSRLRHAQSTLQTLDAYRTEYANRLRSITHATRDALANHRRFLDKLSVALKQQQYDVDQAAQALAHQQAEWTTSMRKLKAMELLRNRRAAASALRLRRVEQKQTDEFAARRLRRFTPGD